MWRDPAPGSPAAIGLAEENPSGGQMPMAIGVLLVSIAVAVSKKGSRHSRQIGGKQEGRPTPKWRGPQSEIHVCPSKWAGGFHVNVDSFFGLVERESTRTGINLSEQGTTQVAYVSKTPIRGKLSLKGSYHWNYMFSFLSRRLAAIEGLKALWNLQ